MKAPVCTTRERLWVMNIGEAIVRRNQLRHGKDIERQLLRLTINDVYIIYISENVWNMYKMVKMITECIL